MKIKYTIIVEGGKPEDYPNLGKSPSVEQIGRYILNEMGVDGIMTVSGTTMKMEWLEHPTYRSWSVIPVND